jgi:hypothetical protein
MTHSSGIIILTTEDNKVAITRFQDDRLQVISMFQHCYNAIDLAGTKFNCSLMKRAFHYGPK